MNDFISYSGPPILRINSGAIKWLSRQYAFPGESRPKAFVTRQAEWQGFQPDLHRDSNFGDTRFHVRPFMNRRGAEQSADPQWGTLMAMLEPGQSGRFGQYGHYLEKLAHLHLQQTGVTDEFGFRHIPARKYGLQLGIDVAFGSNNPIFYIQFGSAWYRP